MLQQGMTVLMGYDENDGWHETNGSVKHRIREATGFAKHEITLMESSGANGITEVVSFKVRGFGWCLDFVNGNFVRDARWDEEPEVDEEPEA